jgi:hypothetical protein
MVLNPDERRKLQQAGGDLSRGLVLSLVLGTLALLGLVFWFMRTAGGIWG